MSVVVVSQNVSPLCAVRKARQKDNGVQGKKTGKQQVCGKFSQPPHMQASELGVADELCLDEFKRVTVCQMQAEMQCGWWGGVGRRASEAICVWRGACHYC